MDDITTSLQNIEIKESRKVPFIISRITDSCVHQQKCYIPPQVFWSLDLLPGDPITLRYSKTMIFLRAFPSFQDSNIIEVHGIVECPSQNYVELEFIKLQPKKINSIVIDVVYNGTFNNIWLSQNRKLLSIIERRILKNLLFCAGSTVQFETIPDALTLGVKKIVIVQANTKDVGFISSRTKIHLRRVITEHQYQQSYVLPMKQLFGVNKILGDFLEIIDANIKYKKVSNKPLPPIKQVLLAGPSGSGKSSLVQVLSKCRLCSLVRVLGQDVAHRDPGQAERQLRNFFEEAFLCANNNDTELCIILIEDIDILCPSGKYITSHTSRLTSQLMLLLDKCQETSGIVVIATTNKPANISTGLRRHGRLAKEVFMGKPSENERNEIISNYLDIFGNFNSNENVEISNTIANITPGFLGADLMFLCQMACFKISNFTTTQDNVKTGIQIMKDVLLGMKPASLRNEVEVIPGGTISPAIGGLDKVKKQLELSIYCSLLQPHIYSRLGILKPRGILLYGPPGCAKTSLVKTLATVGNITVLCASSASIYSPYVGDAEKAIVNLFQTARQNTPAIIFFDEIDSLVGSRSYSNDSNNVQERVLAALLTQMDGIGLAKEVADFGYDCMDGDNVVVIAATNRPNEIDPALLRPGRFDRHIYVPPPDAKSRLHILSIVTKETPLDNDVDLEDIAARTENYSGADLKNLHTETVLQAMEEDGIDVTKIKKKHYDTILKVMKPSLNGGDDDKFRNIFLTKTNC